MAPRKKAKKSVIVSKNVVLKALVGMPMDIIFEVRQILHNSLSVQPAT
jgi:hypothetical protein